MLLSSGIIRMCTTSEGTIHVPMLHSAPLSVEKCAKKMGVLWFGIALDIGEVVDYCNNTGQLYFSWSFHTIPISPCYHAGDCEIFEINVSRCCDLVRLVLEINIRTSQLPSQFRKITSMYFRLITVTVGNTKCVVSGTCCINVLYSTVDERKNYDFWQNSRASNLRSGNLRYF